MMRRVTKYVLIFLIVVVVLLGAGCAYLFFLGGLETTVNNKIAALLGEDSPLEVRVGKVKGNLLSGVVLHDVVIRYRDSLFDYRLASIPSLAAGYSLSNLWDKKYNFDCLYLDSAHLMIAKDSAGRIILPVAVASGEKEHGPEFSVDDLQLRHCRLTLLAPRDTVELRDVVVSCAVQAEDDMYSASVRQLSFHSDIEDLELDAAGGNVTVSGGKLYCQDLTLVSRNTRLKASGSIDYREPSGHIDFALDQVDLERVTGLAGGNLTGILDVVGKVTFHGGEWSGTIDVGGDLALASFENLFVGFRYSDKHLVLDTLYGTVLGNCAVDGTGHIDFSGEVETYSLLGDIKNFNLENLVENSFPSDLSGRINLEGRSFGKEDLTLNVEAELFESSFDGYPMHVARGGLQITTDFVQFIDSFRVHYYENIFCARGKVEYSGDIDLDLDIELHNLDRYKGKLFIDQPGGRGRAHVTLSGASNDPDLRGYLSSDSLWMYGLYADSSFAAFDIDRFLTGRRGHVRTRFHNGSAWQIPYDTAYAYLTLDSHLAFLDTVSIGSEFAGAAATGSLDYGSYPNRLVLDRLSLEILERGFSNQAPMIIAVDSSGFDFKEAAIGNETAGLSVRGRVNYDNSMDMALLIERIPIAPWLRLFNQELPLDGYVSCATELAGDFDSPELNFRGSVDSLTYRELVLGDLTVNARYEDRQMTIDSFLVSSQPGTYRASGYLHLDLAFTADSLDRLPDSPFDLVITARDNRFDLVSLFMPSVEHLEGDFLADIHLTGTPSEPHLEGEAYVRNATLKYFDLVDSVHSDSAGVTMHDNRIVIDGIAGYVKDWRKGGKKSYALVEGTITVKSLDNFHYDLDVTLPKEFPFRYELADIEDVAEGELHVIGDTPPLVTGELTLISGRYFVDFASEEEGSPIMEALTGGTSWDLNLNIDILSNYWIKNDDIDAEFSGYINLIREKGGYRFIGEMDILRGRGFLFDKTFRIEPGSNVVFEDTEYPNPRLDITACTRIPGVRFEEEERPEFTELCVHVTGTLDYPELNTTEGDSTFTREDILPLIVANYYGGQAGSPGAFEGRMTQLISSEMSQIGSKQLSHLGVETFEIEPAYGGQTDLSSTQVTLGFYTAPRLYVYGRSTLSGQSGQAVGFEYRFSRSLILEGRRDEEELYHLNLNLHWEF